MGIKVYRRLHLPVLPVCKGPFFLLGIKLKVGNEPKLDRSMNLRVTGVRQWSDRTSSIQKISGCENARESDRDRVRGNVHESDRDHAPVHIRVRARNPDILLWLLEDRPNHDRGCAHDCVRDCGYKFSTSFSKYPLSPESCPSTPWLVTYTQFLMSSFLQDPNTLRISSAISLAIPLSAKFSSNGNLRTCSDLRLLMNACWFCPQALAFQ